MSSVTTSSSVTSVINKHKYGDTPVVHRVERVPLSHSPDRSHPGLIPARGPLLLVLPSISHTFLSISLYNKA